MRNLHLIVGIYYDPMRNKFKEPKELYVRKIM